MGKLDDRKKRWRYTAQGFGWCGIYCMLLGTTFLSYLLARYILLDDRYAWEWAGGTLVFFIGISMTLIADELRTYEKWWNMKKYDDDDSLIWKDEY